MKLKEGSKGEKNLNVDQRLHGTSRHQNQRNSSWTLHTCIISTPQPPQQEKKRGDVFHLLKVPNSDLVLPFTWLSTEKEK